MKKRTIRFLCLLLAVMLWLGSQAALPVRAEECAHVYTASVTTPTCQAQGFTTYSCTLCGHSYVDAYTEVSDHTYVGGTCVICGFSVLGYDWIAPDFAQGDYTMVVVPDTQNLVSYWPEYYYDLCQWIVDNKDDLNIQAVLNMGDMVNDDTDAEWSICRAGTDLINEAGIPWMPMMGNHGDSEWFNQYYDYETYGTNQSWFGGSYEPGKLDHTYWFVTAGGREYLIFSLGWVPSSSVLNWAKGIVEEYAHKNVIVTAHAYMNKGGTFFSYEGRAIWAAFRSYENLVLAMGGHIHSQDVIYRVDKNGAGENVTSLLFDRQDDDFRQHLGMLALLTFHADSDTVDINWYSTCYDALYRNKNQFSISVPHVHQCQFVTETIQASCTQDGRTYQICTLCGHIYGETVIPAYGHSYGDWSTLAEAACTADGRQRRDCTVCDHYETRSVAALGHSFESIVVEPTCTTPGYSTLVCGRCGHWEREKGQVDITGQFVWTENTAIQATTGAQVTDGNWISSDYVDISPYPAIEIVTANTASANTVFGIAFYDGNRNYISGIRHTDGSGVYGVLTHSIAIPENAVYIRSTWYSPRHGSYSSAFGDFYCLAEDEVYVDALGHTPGETVVEHVDDHDELVICCTVCGEELSRVSFYGYTPGDVNGDGEIDIFDANLIVACYNGAAVLNDEQLNAANVNGDGEVDIFDANLIVAYYNGKIPSFPNE